MAKKKAAPKAAPSKTCMVTLASKAPTHAGRALIVGGQTYTLSGKPQLVGATKKDLLAAAKAAGLSSADLIVEV